MNLKPEQIPDEVVEAAFDAMRLAEASQFGDIKTPNNGARHECMRHALAAALPVLLGEPVGWKCTARPSPEGTQAIQFTHNPESADTFACLGWTVTPVYTLPTQDTSNADQ